MPCRWHRMQNMASHARFMNDSNGPGSLKWAFLSKTYMFSNCPTPPLKKYINLKGLPNKKILCQWHRMHDFCVRKSIISRRIGSRIQQGFSPWIRVQGVLFDEKNRSSKISWHCPFKSRAVDHKIYFSHFYSPLFRGTHPLKLCKCSVWKNYT
jgi:hypothetical protein